MPDQPSTLELILHEVAQAVLPLSEAATRDPVPTGLTSLLTDAGVDVSTLGVTTDQLTDICADVATAVAAIEQAAGGNGPAGGAGSDPAQLAGRIADLVTQLHNLDRAPQPADLGTAAERLLAYTITLYLRRQRPGVYAFLRLAGLMVEPSSDSRDTTPPRLDPRRLADLFSDPNKMLAQAYRWGGTDVDYPMLLDHLQQMALVLGFPAIAHRPDTDLLTALGVDINTLPNTASLRIALATFQTGEIAADVGLEVLAHRTPGSPDGVAIVPFGAGDLTERLPLDEHWSMQIDAEGDAAVPYGLVITPAGLVFEAVDGAARQLVLVVRLAIERDQPAGQSTTVLGSPTGSRLDAGTLSLTLFASANPADVGVEVDGTDWRIVAKAEPGDGFLATLLPPEGIQIPFSLGLGWSHSKGVYFVGRAGLRVELAVNKDLGPVHISNVSVEAVAGASTADPNAQKITANAAVTGRLQLGPFVVTVRDIGVRLGLQPGAEHPNAAIGAFEAGFKPPTGAGIAITNPAISGGGFLLLDEANGTYAGIVELTLVKTVSVVAIGIVTTKLPDGRPGFALLIIITAQGFTPIQLGMGFTLTGIGGLVALNRTVNADAIRNGLRDGILDSVMFVKDPVKNADRVLSTLDKVFPIARDRLVVGPMAEISWGTPTIVTLRLALLLDLPAPIRVVVLAALAVKLPTPQTPVVEIHVDAVGELDFGRGRLSLDASLHHSRILTFTLTGDLSLRLDWGTEPGFLLSIGGFHPRFKPPPGIRPLNRLALQLTDSDNPLVRFEAYLAITPNTLQMGAKAMVRLDIAGFVIAGGGSFDTLIQWSPFHLEVDVAVWASISAGGLTLLALNLALSVSGPEPWHLAGTASFRILFFEVSVGVDITLGSSPTATEPVESVNVTELVWQQVGQLDAWEASLPVDLAPGVTLTTDGPDGAPGGGPGGGTGGDRLAAHPLANISVRQKVVPLGQRISHVGARVPVGGAQTLNLNLTTPQGLGTAPVTELFAPAQFIDLPGEQRLSAPSFQPMTAGRRLAPAAAASAGPSTNCQGMVETLEVTSLEVAAETGAPAAAVTPPGGGS